MKSKQNRNIILVGLAAVAVAAITASALFIANRGDDGEQLSAGQTTARRLLTPAPLDPGKSSATRDAVVAFVASEGSADVIIEVAANLSPNASAQDRAAAVRASQDNVIASAQGSVNVVARTTSLPMMLVNVDEAGARSLAASTSVVSMTRNHEYRPSLDETIPLIGAPAVYAQGYTGSGWSVAVLDTAQDTDHHFFADRVLQSLCFSSNTESFNSICSNGQDTEFGPGSSANCRVDWCVHGTHVVGIAAGNGSGGSGVAKDAGIISINVFHEFKQCAGQENCIRSATFDRIQALNWILENHAEYKIASVNVSIGGGQYFDQATCDSEEAAEKSAIDALLAVNVVVVMASGNEDFTDSLGGPGCISSGIAVGSTKKDDTISTFSNSSDMLDILAPGQDIQSAAPGGGWAFLSGTSMASPHVAGAFAVLRSAKPEASVQELYNALDEGGVSFRDPRNGLVRPRLQLDGALAALIGGNRPQPTPAPRPQPRPAPAGAPENDDENGAVSITGPSFQHRVDTRLATLADDPGISPTYYCSEGGRFDHTVWYEFTAPNDGYLTVTTEGSNYDTILSAWVGSRGRAYQVGCNDDDWYPDVLTSTIAGWVAAGTSFRIQVAAWDNGGSLVLSAKFQSSNASSVVTNSGLAPVVFDAALSEAPSDLASSRPANVAQVPAACQAKGVRPAELKGECYRGPAPR